MRVAYCFFLFLNTGCGPCGHRPISVVSDMAAFPILLGGSDPGDGLSNGSAVKIYSSGNKGRQGSCHLAKQRESECSILRSWSCRRPLPYLSLSPFAPQKMYPVPGLQTPARCQPLPYLPFRPSLFPELLTQHLHLGGPQTSLDCLCPKPNSSLFTPQPPPPIIHSPSCSIQKLGGLS